MNIGIHQNDVASAADHDDSGLSRHIDVTYLVTCFVTIRDNEWSGSVTQWHGDGPCAGRSVKPARPIGSGGEEMRGHA